jgi:hypothetical protein
MEWNALGWKGQDRKGMNAANKMEDMNEIHSKTVTGKNGLHRMKEGLE